jgi:hypothetical protein
MSRITGHNTRQGLLEEFGFTFKFPPIFVTPVQMFGTVQQEEDV